MNAKSAGSIRITHCIGSMRRGGAEGQLAELIARLPKDRYCQSLVLLEGGGQLLKGIRRTSCEVVELGYSMRYRKFDPRFYLALSRALILFVRHLKKFRPQVVHGWLYWANVIAVASSRLAGVPAVMTSRRQLGRFKDGRPGLQRIENFFNRHTTLVLANSEAVKADALARENLGPQKIVVVHNGVDAARFAAGNREETRERLGLGEDDFVALVLANFHEYKGHADAVEASRRLAREVPGLKLVFAGRDAGAESGLKMKISQAGLESRVVFAGEDADTPGLLAACDLLVHPSHEEGFPNAILETMAAGRPVVAYAVGGCREAVEEGVTGLLAPAYDIGALTAAIETLALDADLRKRMGDAGGERARREYSMNRMVDRMDRIYSALAAGTTLEAL